MLDLHDMLLLGATGRVADLVRLLPLFPPRPFEPGTDAARAANAILQRAAPEDIAWLERHRPSGSEWGSAHPSWDALGPDELGVDTPATDGPHAAVLSLASMHSNGFVRANGWTLRDQAQRCVSLETGARPRPGDLFFRIGEQVLWNAPRLDLDLKAFVPRDQVEPASWYLSYADMDILDCIEWQLAFGHRFRCPHQEPAPTCVRMACCILARPGP